MIQKSRLPKKLSGAAQPNEWRVRTGAGVFLDIRDTGTIFPILKRKAGVPGSKWNVVGTGFFVCTNGIFVTARHVLLDDTGEPGANDTVAIIQFKKGNNYYLRPVLRAWSHGRSDISIAIAAGMHHVDTKKPLENNILTLTERTPDLGHDIGTYAFPNSASFIEDGTHHLVFEPAFYSGKLIEAFPDGRDSVVMRGPCFQTSIHLHGGASGGPVFDGKTGRVFAVNTTSFDGARDVSYVSKVSEILDGRFANIVFADDGTPREASIRELAERGFIVFDPPLISADI